MQRYFDVVQSRNGDAIVGGLVSVFISGTTTLATLYADNGVTLQANPVTTNTDGEYAFYAANGTYTLQITATNYATETKPGVVLFDPFDAGASNNVQFLQAGTGAQVRSVQSKLRDVVSVKDFGAVGNGVADDTGAIQSAVNYASTIGADVTFPTGTYCITSGITIKCTGDLAEEGTGSYIHFSPSNPVNLVSDSQAVLKATASMAFMVKYTYDVADGDIAPFYSRVEGMSFDGNNVATDCIYIDFSMHMHIESCRFWGYTGAGIHNFGYGVAQYVNNVFRGPKGIFIERGGDSLIDHNDFFPTNNGIGVDCGYFSGNTTISSNIFTNEGTGNLYGVRLSGDYAASGSEEVRHLIIQANEFCGMTAGVYGIAFSTSARNVYQCAIVNNHVTPYTSTNIGCLADLRSCEGIIISGNWVNKDGFSTATGTYGLYLFNCIGCIVENNIFENLTNEAIRLTDALRCQIKNNYFYDCGKGGASFVIVQIFNNSQHNHFEGNYFYQSSNSFAQNGIYEQTGPNNNQAYNNRFTTVATPYFRSGANSWFWRREPGIARPTTGRYHKGDVVINVNPTVTGAGGSQYIVKEWVRITDGVNHVVNTDWVEARTLTGT